MHHGVVNKVSVNICIFFFLLLFVLQLSSTKVCVSVLKCEKSETCQLSGRPRNYSLTSRQGNQTLGQLVISYFTNSCISALTTNWARSSVLPGAFGSKRTCTDSEKWKIFLQNSDMWHMLGAGNPKRSKFLWVSCCVAVDLKFEVGKCFLKRHFLWQTAPGWTISFIWLMKSEKAPLKVTRSACSVEKKKHYFAIMPTSDALCTLLFHHCGNNCSLPAPWKVIMGWESPVDLRQTTSFVL